MSGRRRLMVVLSLDECLLIIVTRAEQTETLSDLEDFFQPDDGTGECLTDKMARITEQALRGKKSKKDDEKLKGLREKYKRPKNIENLQAPTVDAFARRQMKREVKRVDYALKKGVLDCAQAITPLAKPWKLCRGTTTLSKPRAMLWTP